MRLLRTFFHWLYHGLAFAYDLVAWTVSFGQWTTWIQAVLPHLHGTRILELGHGPGHLQRLLLDGSAGSSRGRTLQPFGLDESRQMGRLAKVNIARGGYTPNLTRSIAQSLPFAAETFDSLVATFPSEYIFDARTLAEVKRVLRRRGRLVVLPAAWPKNRLLGWLFKVTGQSPAEALEIVKEKLRVPFAHAGFETEVQTLEVKSGLLLLVIAEKQAEVG